MLTNAASSDALIQRREFKDYQPLFTLINGLSGLDHAVKRDFGFKFGPVWVRYNEATKGAAQRRITALFLCDETGAFDELLWVGCDCVRQRSVVCAPLWSGHPLLPSLGEPVIHHLCVGMAGRSVLRLTSLLSAAGAAAGVPAGVAPALPLAAMPPVAASSSGRGWAAH